MSTDGIGAFVQRSEESFQVSAGLAGIIAIAIMGLAVNIALRQVERRLLFWHYRANISDA